MIALFPLAALFLAQSALAGEKSVKKPTHPAPAPKVLLDAWYTVTAGKTPYGYYNDHVELRGNRLFFQNHYWKKEEDYINEEQLGAYSEADPELTPVFFNFHLTYRSSEVTVDGTVADGRKFSARVRTGGEELPIIRRTIPEHTIFAVFFPAWLQMKSGSMKPGDHASFQSILEDSWDQGFAIVPGHVRAEKNDGKFDGRKFTVDYENMKSTWWLDSKGVSTRIEMPSQKITVERVRNEQEARKFLE